MFEYMVLRNSVNKDLGNMYFKEHLNLQFTYTHIDRNKQKINYGNFPVLEKFQIKDPNFHLNYKLQEKKIMTHFSRVKNLKKVVKRIFINMFRECNVT